MKKKKNECTNHLFYSCSDECKEALHQTTPLNWQLKPLYPLDQEVLLKKKKREKNKDRQLSEERTTVEP